MEGIVKLTAENDLFYDSVEKLYRYRMHCPECGTISGCRCFPDLEEAELATVSETDYACSSRCSLLYSYENSDGQIEEALQCIGFNRPIKDLTVQESEQIISFLYKDIDTRECIRDIIDDLEINKHVSQLSHEERIKILIQYDATEFSIISTCDLIGIEMQRPLESITEEEARKVLDIAEIDFDCPDGDSC